MTLLAHIAEEHRGQIAIARLNGEIDASNVNWIESRLRALLTNQSDGLTVDLSDTSYLDSAGIALMFSLAATLREHRQQLRLVVVDGSPIARMVALTGLDRSVPIHPTLEAAVAEASVAE
jgi:anti-sigma B factor antagonist/stage II sporulation protein AA (anti-sigma F factor antagonist)